MIRRAARKAQVLDPTEARDDTLDGAALSRLGLWGGAAAACLLAVAIASWTAPGKARIDAGDAALTGSYARPDAVSARDDRIEALRLTETIRSLSEDRDRLLARMTVLERNYEDVTGSVRQSSKDSGERTASAVAFAIDIGGASTLASARLAWDRIQQNHGRLVENFRPLVAVREARGGQLELRLIAGPIGSAAAASELCATLVSAGLFCQPTRFEGQRLALH